jgi:uncharacterized protein RhaS with RHS repeats
MSNLPTRRCDCGRQDAPRRLSELQIHRACDLALQGVAAADILASGRRAEGAAQGWLTYWAATRGQPLPCQADAQRFLQVLEERF